jgi:hypothetical protein
VLSNERLRAVIERPAFMERLDERLYGVWVVDPKSGQIAGFLRFEELVQVEAQPAAG